MNVIDTERSPNTFRAAHPEIPALAVQAALELDLLAKNKQSQFDYVEMLATLLVEASDSRGKYSDPVSSDVINRALGCFFAPESETLTDFSNREVEIAEILRKVAHGDSETRVEELRDFCIAISEFSPVAWKY